MKLRAHDLRHGSRGFALIITISLLALLIMVLIAMATLTRLETSVGSNVKSAGQAEQNALYALNIALGELQRHAGPDTRVTATAELAGVTGPNKHWTGVWSSVDGVGQTWLVSGNENGAIAYQPGAVAVSNLSTASTALSDDVEIGTAEARVLVGPNTANDSDAANFVVAPLVDLEGPVAGETVKKIVGRYAWWVGDEGVKAKANIRDSYSEGSATSEEKAVSRAVAQRVGIEQLVSGYPANDLALERVVDRSQMPFVGGVDVSDIRTHFHSLTTCSVGVIADSKNGGIRTDLNRVLAETPVGFADSDPISAHSVDGAPSWGSLRRFYNRRITSGGTVEPSGPTGGSPGAFPLLSSMSVWSGILAHDDRSRLIVTCRASFVLFNPYDAPLASARYRVSVGPGSTVSLVFRKNGSELIPGIDAAVPLSSLGSAGSLSFETDPVSFGPGEVKIFSTHYSGGSLPFYPGVGPIPVAEGNPGFSPAGFQYCAVRYSDVAAPGLDIVSEADTINVRFNGSRVDLVLELAGGSPSILQQVENIGITQDSGSLTRGHTFAAIENGVSVPRPYSNIGTAFSLYMRGASGLATNRSAALGTTNNVQWIAHHDPRASMLARPAGNPWGENPHWDGVRILAGSPLVPQLTRDVSTAGAGVSFNLPPGQSSVAMFHVLRSEPLSLGIFQHAAFSGGVGYGNRLPAFAIGNSYASPYVPVASRDLSYGCNEALWDGYFLSGSVAGSNAASLWDSERSNRRLLRYWPSGVLPEAPVDYRNAGAFRLINGAFNINSVSVDAWSAVISSLNGVEDPNSAGVALQNPVFHTHHPTSPPSILTGGVSELTDTQVQRLAELIAGRVRYSAAARGPFRSVGEFVNRRLSGSSVEVRKGVLQAALDGEISDLPAAFISPAIQPSAWTPVGGTIPASLPFPSAATGVTGTNLPGWVSQADLLTAMAPFLSARSDTFTIRTYGETMNPTTGETEARAWCEAVVQRIPEYVDTEDAPWERGTELNDTNQRFGRRFVITSFRWLSPDDI